MHDHQEIEWEAEPPALAAAFALVESLEKKQQRAESEKTKKLYQDQSRRPCETGIKIPRGFPSNPD